MFFFSRHVKQHAGADQYPLTVLPTNMANWSDCDLAGNVTAVNISGTDLAIVFTRTNPLERLGLSLGPNDAVPLDNSQRLAALDELRAMQVLYVTGTEAFLGMSWDFLPLDDLNYVAIIPTGNDGSYSAYVQIAEQKFPRIGNQGVSL